MGCEPSEERTGTGPVGWGKRTHQLRWEDGDNLLTNRKKFISTPPTASSYINKQFKHLKVSTETMDRKRVLRYTAERRRKGFGRRKDILFDMLRREEGKFQLKSKLSRSKSLKLAIGKCSFLPIFLIHCRCLCWSLRKGSLWAMRCGGAAHMTVLT